MKIKQMKSVPKIRGAVNNIFNREAIYLIATITNAQSDAINYLYEVVCGQNKEIEELKAQLEELKASGSSTR